jgi:hypothetical protein
MTVGSYGNPYSYAGTMAYRGGFAGPVAGQGGFGASGGIGNLQGSSTLGGVASLGALRGSGLAGPVPSDRFIAASGGLYGGGIGGGPYVLGMQGATAYAQTYYDAWAALGGAPSPDPGTSFGPAFQTAFSDALGAASTPSSLNTGMGNIDQMLAAYAQAYEKNPPPAGPQLVSMYRGSLERGLQTLGLPASDIDRTLAAFDAQTQGKSAQDLQMQVRTNLSKLVASTVTFEQAKTDKSVLELKQAGAPPQTIQQFQTQKQLELQQRLDALSAQLDSLS